MLCVFDPHVLICTNIFRTFFNVKYNWAKMHKASFCEAGLKMKVLFVNRVLNVHVCTALIQLIICNH